MGIYEKIDFYKSFSTIPFLIFLWVLLQRVEHFKIFNIAGTCFNYFFILPQLSLLK